MPTPSDAIFLTISGRRYTGWKGLTVTRALDAISTVGFATSWDPGNAELRALFVPLARQSIEVDTGRGERLLTGLITAGAPESDAEGRTLPLAGFGLPGLLEQTRIPDTEFHKIYLDEIARRLTAPSIGLDFRAPKGASFDQVKLEHDKSPWSLLVELSQQVGVLLADSPSGNLLAWQPELGRPVLELREGVPPCGDFGVTLGDEWHAEIVGYSGAKRGRGGVSHRVKNPHFVGPYPTTHEYEESDVKPADLPAAVQAKLGRMIGNAITWTTTLPGIRDPQGDLLAPNTIWRVYHPSSFIYRPTDLLVRRVTYSVSEESLESEVELVLPGAFSGQLPEVMPWVA